MKKLSLDALRGLSERDPSRTQALALVAIAEILEQILHELKVQGGGFPR